MAINYPNSMVLASFLWLIGDQMNRVSLFYLCIISVPKVFSGFCCCSTSNHSDEESKTNVLSAYSIMFFGVIFCKKIPLSRRVEYVMDGSMDE